MIGYKATYNGYCLNQLYKVGETYTLDGELEICKNGFHFCQDLIDVFNYYSPNKNLKIFKVEALGDIDSREDKSVTNKIKILEEVNLSNLIVEKYNSKKYFKKYFDDKGNYIKYETSSGFWERYEYDKNNNRIKYEGHDGSWIKYEYDSNNNLIKEEYSNGNWYKYEHDKNNNRIYYTHGCLEVN